MTWTDIPDASIDPGKPARSIDAKALRDNIAHVRDGNNKLVVFTASGTYTVPAGLKRVKVTVVGGGGGGSGAGNGGAGGTSSFGAHCSATGGVAGTLGAAGSGGAGSGGDVNTKGGAASRTFQDNLSSIQYGHGGCSLLGGESIAAAGSAYGGGGAPGVGSYVGGGGGGGGSIKIIDASALGATETVTVGAAGAAGSGGGFAGAAGIVIIEEFY